MFNQFVPGIIGDPQEPTDTAFGGVGWRYIDSPNYIPYVSTDYDEKGVDISGNNFPDWPLRYVSGKETYVHAMNDRSRYVPVFKSDEEFFAVFKDTDTRADAEYIRKDAPDDTMGLPIGIEVRVTAYSFEGMLKDAMIISYEIINKSGEMLDSCYVGFNEAQWITNDDISNIPDTTVKEYFSTEPARNLALVYNRKPLQYDVSKQVYGGYDVLGSPNKIGMSFWKDDIDHEYPQRSHNDTLRYHSIVSSPSITTPSRFIYFPNNNNSGTTNRRMNFGSGPFHLAIGDTARFSIGLMFAYSLKDLLVLNDIVQNVYDKGIKKPTPPDSPTLSVTPSYNGIHLQWDSKAERSVDPVIPDSLGAPFAGYRLYRAPAKNGPFTLLREWKSGRDSIVHEYRDTVGDNGGPLLTNVKYFYKLTAFDEGVPALKTEIMESDGIVIQSIQNSPSSSPFELENIRIVPNPFVVTHAAQLSIDRPAVFFNYLPDECTIRIYTTALELVAELHHAGGSRAEWNLRTQGGQQVASQLLIAKISTPQGTSIIKKFAVVFAE